MKELTAVVLCVVIGVVLCNEKPKPIFTERKSSAGEGPLSSPLGSNRGHDVTKGAGGPAGTGAKPSDLKGADTIGLGFYGGILPPPMPIPRYYPGYYPRYYPGYYPRYYPGYGPYYPFYRRPYNWGRYPYRPRPIPVLIGR